MGRSDLRRRPHSRRPKKILYLVCEGKNTEPDYFETVAKFDGAVTLQISRGSGSPDAIAEKAAEIAKEIGVGTKKRKGEWFARADEVWAVFDRDEHQHFDAAIDRCNSIGIKVARSNPCFEVWLILHFQDYQRPEGRHAVQKKLGELCGTYDPHKRKTADFKSYLGSLKAAEDRAERQLQNRSDEGDEYGAPSTTVYELTRRITGRDIK